MKIQSILEIIEPEVRSYDMAKRALGKYTKSSGDYDEGHFSRVEKDRDPHFVKKTSKDSERATNDGYWFFIKNVVDSKLWENPYFPRVYQFKKFAKEDGAHYRVQLEKLEEFSTLSKKEQFVIGRKIFGTSQLADRMNDEDGGGFSTKLLIVDLIRNLYFGEVHVEGLDGDLVSAVKILRKMNTDGYEFDLSQYNVMVRRGPTGVHLVITDPFGYSFKFKSGTG